MSAVFSACFRDSVSKARIVRHLWASDGTGRANRAFSQSKVIIKDENKNPIDLGRESIGVILGDNARVGSNCTTSPGTYIGKYSWIYPHTCVHGFIPNQKKVYDKQTHKYNKDLLKIEDKWILNKLDKLVNDVTHNIENYELGIALDKIYSFIWNEFCDWYIEIVKPRLYSENEEEKVKVCFTLVSVFSNVLKLLHPV